MPCNRNLFPAPNRTVCQPCPGVGTECVQGVVHFAPNVYAPPEVRGQRVTPDTRLYKCPKRNTCEVNTTREDGVVDMKCKEGYAGPTCSVCDVKGGYVASFGTQSGKTPHPTVVLDASAGIKKRSPTVAGDARTWSLLGSW